MEKSSLKNRLKQGVFFGLVGIVTLTAGCSVNPKSAVNLSSIYQPQKLPALESKDLGEIEGYESDIYVHNEEMTKEVWEKQVLEKMKQKSGYKR